MPGESSVSRHRRLKAERSTRRSKQVDLMVNVPGLSLLQAASVSEATKGTYAASVQAFYEFCRIHNLLHASVNELDLAMVEFMNAGFLDGDGGYVGSRLLAALSYIRPELGRPCDMGVHRAKQALRGWKRLAPGFSRLPLPWEVVAGVAMLMLSEGLWVEAMGVLISVIFYLRPGELVRLQVRSLVPPLLLAGPGHRHWTLIMHEQEHEGSKASKTGVFDESLILDLDKYQFLAPALAKLVANRPPSAPLIDLPPGRLAHVLASIGSRLGMKPSPLLYQLRHSGPSIDFADQSRDLMAIKRRGRWKSDSSLRRYEKGAQITKQLRALPGSVQSFVVRAATSLPGVLGGRLRPLTLNVRPA
jgi:hypothetical protein